MADRPQVEPSEHRYSPRFGAAGAEHIIPPRENLNISQPEISRVSHAPSALGEQFSSRSEPHPAGKPQHTLGIP